MALEVEPDVAQSRLRQQREAASGLKRQQVDAVLARAPLVELQLALVEMDAVELHPWAATVDNIENPDRLVFDLDPGPGIEWQFVIETALALRVPIGVVAPGTLPRFEMKGRRWRKAE